MQLPLQIAFHNMEPSPAVEARVREHADRLGRYHDRITACRVVIDLPHRHQHGGKVFHVRIDVTVPSGELVVNREHEVNHAHEDVFVAVRDAFEAIRRRLQELVDRQRGAVKTHEAASTRRGGTSRAGGGRQRATEHPLSVETLRAQLLQRRNQLFRQAVRAEDDLHWLDTNVEIEVEDEGQEAALALLLARLDTHDRDEIEGIDRALGRMATGDYGRCLICQQLIPAARLEALPEAEHCIACAAASEQGAATDAPALRSSGGGT